MAQIPENLIDVRGLGKTFGGTRVLHGVNLQIPAGHLVGLVGPNGAGKSCLLRQMVGLDLPDAGRCLTLGVDAAHLGADERAALGYVHQEASLPGWMRCDELIRFTAAHFRTWQRELEDHLMTLFDLDPLQHVRRMSPGDRQKLSILLAVAYEPRLLILDEPASALDPLARKNFLGVLAEVLQGSGRTVVISSHILSDIEQVIDRVLVMDAGRLTHDSDLDELKEEYVKLELISLRGDLPSPLPFRRVFDREQEGGHAYVTLRRPDWTDEEITTRLNCDLRRHPLSFDEIYPLLLQEASGVGRHG